MEEAFKSMLEYVGILTLVTVFWQFLELIAYGEIMGDTVDSIIGLVFAASLYANYKNFMKK